MSATRPLLGLERRWWTLIAVCGSTFMLLVDVTIVQVALPTIQRHLGGSFTDLQWMIDAYALTLAAFLLTFGSLADRFGRKTVFIAGTGVFTVASLLCAFAQSAAVLIGARALQGFGGAAMFATGLALIGQEFQGAERGKAIAAWSATVGVGVAVGPLVGGALTQGLGWQWIFIVNAPIGVAVIVLALPQMVNISDPGATRLDWAGLITLAGALFTLMLGLLRGNDAGWGSTLIVALFAASVVLMVAFVLAELRHPRPMFDLSLLRKPAFVGVTLATFAAGAGMFALLPYLTLYLQNDLGYAPLTGGLCLLPFTVPCFVVPIGARSAFERLPAKAALSVGMAISAAGLALMSRLSVSSTWTALIPGLVLAGIGLGIVNPAIARIALGVVPPQRTGMASGISNTARIGGLATGVAALGAVFQSRLSTSLAARLGHPASQLARALASGGIRAARRLAPHRHDIITALHHAFVSGADEILAIGAIVVFVGALVGLALVRGRDFYRAPAAPPPNPVR